MKKTEITTNGISYSLQELLKYKKMLQNSSNLENLQPSISSGSRPVLAFVLGKLLTNVNKERQSKAIAAMSQTIRKLQKQPEGQIVMELLREPLASEIHADSALKF